MYILTDKHSKTMILMIDNYDSFTYNIVQYLGELQQEVVVKRNDQCSLVDIETMHPTFIFLSPGPGTPTDAGICLELVDHFKGKIPILGVCLGLQVICQVFGGEIIRAKEILHGKTSEIWHNNTGIYKGLKSHFSVTRYHSLVANQDSLPDCLAVTSWTRPNGSTNKLHIDEIMGVRHKKFNIEGVQFHPESIKSEFGHQMFNNFLKVKTA